MFSEIKTEHDRCRWSSYKLNIEKSANNVFWSKETTKNVPPNIFRDFKITKKGTIDLLKAKRKVES